MNLAALPLKVLIVDDEKNACINLRDMLFRYAADKVHVIGMAHNTAEAEILIRSVSPDAVFMDIDMPGENAFTLLNRLAPVNFEVIFVTAYDEYAVKAIKLNALDYILKPIDIDELTNSIHKLTALANKNKTLHDIEAYKELQNQIDSRAKQNRLILRSLNNMELVNFADIYFIEAQQNYSKFYFAKDGITRETVVSTTLMEYEELLPADMFFRVHRSYLVNCTYIERIMTSAESSVVVKGTYNIPVARRRYQPLLDFLKTYGYQRK